MPKGDTDTSLGQMIVGGTTSVTVTLKLHVDESRALSVAVHVTLVVVAPPNWKPEAGEQLVLLMPDSSVALAMYVTVAKLLPVSGLRTIVPGHVMLGCLVSTTVTVNMHVDCRLKVFVATHVTVLVPSWNVDGDVGEHDVDTACPESSVALAVYEVNADGELPLVWMTRFAGHVITGGAFWFTLTLNEQLDCRLALSMAVHVTTVVPMLNDDPLDRLQELL
jgi:hypothetical protein